MRQVLLDTETTGFPHSQGHKIIEIGCVELFDRQYTGNNFQVYLNPERESDAGALEVHGLSTEKLKDKPLFAEVAEDFINYIRGAELLIHNAPFDIGFLNMELSLLSKKLGKVEDYASVVDTLKMAKRQHPGGRNSLDALCKRYGVDNSRREKHGALLDSEILGDVYLAMTGGQTSLSLQQNDAKNNKQSTWSESLPDVRVIQASEDELAEHQRYLDMLFEKSGDKRWVG